MKMIGILGILGRASNSLALGHFSESARGIGG
jgi:hypothetical protein